MQRLCLWAAGLALAWLAVTVPVSAHEIRPAVVTATFTPDGRYEIIVSTNLEALLAGIGSEHKDSNDAPEAKTYNALRGLAPVDLKRRFESFQKSWLDGLQVKFDGTRAAPVISTVESPEIGDVAVARISKITLLGQTPAAAQAFTWAYPDMFGSSVLRVQRIDGGEMFEAGWLQNGKASEAIALAGGATKSKLSLFFDYIAVGFVHIIPKGLDHILFVVGLYLLSPSWRPLLLQVTAFTVAHSITLALGLYGVIEVSPAIIEPMIALSIVYVAVENILTPSLQPWRPFVVFAFGLLHGLGFAGVLQEVGLAPANYATGLIGFNIGVELGQLAVIACAFMLTGYWFRERSWYRQRIVWPASAVIALAGMFWTVERLMSSGA